MVQRITAQQFEFSDDGQYMASALPSATIDLEWWFGLRGSVDNGGKVVQAKYLLIDNSLNDASVRVGLGYYAAYVAPYTVQTMQLPDLDACQIILQAGGGQPLLVFSTMQTGAPTGAAKIITASS